MLICLKWFSRINFIEVNEQSYVPESYFDKMMDEHRGDYGGPDDFMSRGANERLDG
jgi:hypothetical protein